MGAVIARGGHRRRHARAPDAFCDSGVVRAGRRWPRDDGRFVFRVPNDTGLFGGTIRHGCLTITAGRLTYHLRRLRLHARSRGYQAPVATGSRGRVAHGPLLHPRARPTLQPGLAIVLPDAAGDDAPLRRAFDQIERTMDQWYEETKLAA